MLTLTPSECVYVFVCAVRETWSYHGALGAETLGLCTAVAPGAAPKSPDDANVASR